MFFFLEKLKNKKKKEKISKLDSRIIKYIETISDKINNLSKINFSHSGHLGDLINSLPVIKEISKKKNCNLFININKRLTKKDIDISHPAKEFYLTKDSFLKLKPLLESQDYIKEVNIFENQEIDIELDFFRELPMNLNIDSVRWYSHICGINPNLNNPYLVNIKKNNTFQNKIIIMRSLRRQNKDISFRFLQKFEDIVFTGLLSEYEDLRKQIPNMKFYDCDNFLELAEIIKSCKLFIGNLSFGYTIAEALKVPRLLESKLNFPLVYPNGLNAYEFYFQCHFEKYVKEILNN